MESNPNYDTQDKRYGWMLVRLLLTPSWLSGLCTACVAIGITVAIVIQGQYQGSELQRQFLYWRTAGDDGTLSSATEAFKLNSAHVVAVLETFVFWYAVGTALYLVVSTLYRTLRSANDAWRELHYTNRSRSRFLRSLYARFALRSMVLVVWVLYIFATLRVLVPYLLSAIHIGDQHFPSVGAIGLLTGATAALVVVFHVHIILFRLLAARPRVFGGTDEVALYVGH